MSEAEFDEQAAAIAEQLRDADFEERVAGACRGSGNPAALAWLGEALEPAPGTTVVDLGAGLGGPAAWLSRRFGCRAVAVEPAWGAVRSAPDLFGLCCVQASASASPFRAQAFDVGLLLGVVSVVPDARDPLREARRVCRRLGLLEYCATRGPQLEVGGSRFPGQGTLEAHLRHTGWRLGQASPLTMSPPQRWSAAAEDASNGAAVDMSVSERKVVDAIDRGDLAPHLFVAT